MSFKVSSNEDRKRRQEMTGCDDRSDIGGGGAVDEDKDVVECRWDRNGSVVYAHRQQTRPSGNGQV